jgi:hypothetical protein
MTADPTKLEACSQAINTDGSMAWFSIIRRQRIDSTVAVAAVLKPHDRLVTFGPLWRAIRCSLRVE